MGPRRKYQTHPDIYRVGDCEWYDILEACGRGYYGYVNKVVGRDSGKVFAVKTLLNHEEVNLDENEAELMLDIGAELGGRHWNLVEYYGYRCNMRTKRVDIYMEYCSNGDLEEYMEEYCMSWYTAIKFMEHTANGVRYLHKNVIVHRDLKPSNILLQLDPIWGLTAKIGDFGVSACLGISEEYFSEIHGDRRYRAPEVNSGHYTNAVDVYSLGRVYLDMKDNVQRIPSSNNPHPKVRRINWLIGRMIDDYYPTRIKATSVYFQLRDIKATYY